MRVLLLLFSTLVALSASCQIQSKKTVVNNNITVGAERFDQYLSLIKGKNVAIVSNQTSLVDGVHLVDTLLSLGIEIKKVLAPEHGFRGNAANGETVKDGLDIETGLPVVSLYGKNKKPSPEMLSDIDIIIFDIQDVGARFYTYISTMHYVMEAAAEQNKKVIILDRPNPNGFYVDGPVLKKEFTSFVGMHEIPVVHGLTVAELALMINGEKWLKDGIQSDITIITCENYSHNDLYELPIAPSPNLPNMTSVYLYPSLCFFESTDISVGRGTDLPFQIIGFPENPAGNLEFTPKSIEHVSNYPKHEDLLCKGFDLRDFGSFYFTSKGELYLEWILGMYEVYPDKEKFFNSNNFFDKLAGTEEFKVQIIEQKSSEEIKESWREELIEYKKMRKQYLLYEDFE